MELISGRINGILTKYLEKRSSDAGMNLHRMVVFFLNKKLEDKNQTFGQKNCKRTFPYGTIKKMKTLMKEAVAFKGTVRQDLPAQTDRSRQGNRTRGQKATK